MAVPPLAGLLSLLLGAGCGPGPIVDIQGGRNVFCVRTARGKVECHNYDYEYGPDAFIEGPAANTWPDLETPLQWHGLAGLRFSYLHLQLGHRRQLRHMWGPAGRRVGVLGRLGLPGPGAKWTGHRGGVGRRQGRVLADDGQVSCEVFEGNGITLDEASAA